MGSHITIGLVGDRDDSVTAHRAIPAALRQASDALDNAIQYEWVPTDQITDVDRVSRYDGLWCVPASPYRSMFGAMLAIQHARECFIPFLGTCGGFQHAIIEYALNALGWPDADHAETAIRSARFVVAPLECALVEMTGTVRLVHGSRLAAVYGTDVVTVQYHCRYGLNPEFATQLLSGPLRAAANDAKGEVRAVELNDHPFFIATLFQPERAALNGTSSPLIRAFVEACQASRSA